MQLPINQIICGNNVDVLSTFPAESVDLTVTSPPYDKLRAYKGFTFDFEGLATQLFRVTKHGGAVVWVVADETRNFNESLTSFKQAIYFVETCGFNLLDTMFYVKRDYPPAYPTIRRYAGVVEYMFVFSKDKPKTFNSLKAPKAESTIDRQKSIQNIDMRQSDGSQIRVRKKISATDSNRTNAWEYRVGGNYTGDVYALEHPARFPERLAEDHILSWSNPGDLVLDPMCGSGTTLKMAIKHNRQYIGIDCAQEYCDLSERRIASVQQSLLT